ncbi:hypothetical protein A7K91_10735 [Paenibacillus oryzae]|uniref:Uncharacterized protein n=1 Tax=Paenibacillus oryzae TaxID=1844972 RepID=A0A1A5YIU3_9BACL|nr:hypothetical protein [Paenibacillus oryzae]OBR65517.1 hypothetical protein A7K91_10735 [Paenibacillus oryzae]
MTIMKQLIGLEYRSIGKPFPLLITYYILGLAGVGYFFREQNAPEFLFLFGPALVMVTMLMVSAIQMISIPASPFRDWWLTLPHSRRLLVSAKMRALLLMGMLAAPVMLLVCLTVYVLLTLFGSMQALPAGQLLSLSLSSLALGAAVVPLSVSYGMSIAFMASGRSRMITLVPYACVFFAAVGTIGVISVLNEDTAHLFTSARMLLYAGVALLAGIPVAFGLSRLIASKGIAMLTSSSVTLNKSVARAGSVTDKKEKAVALKSKSAFSAVFRLELSGFRYYEKKLPFVIIVSAILIAWTATAFFAGKPLDGTDNSSGMFVLPTLIAVMLMLFWDLFHRKTMVWQLGFPIKRSLLLTANVAAHAVLAIKWMLILALGYYIGLGAAVLTGKTEPAAFEAIPWTAYSILLRTIAMIFILSLLQLRFVFYRFTFLYILIFPLYWLAGTHSSLLDRYFYPIAPAGGVAPAWELLGLLTLAALPISVLCLWLGGKYVHHALTATINWDTKKKEAKK